MPDFTGTFREEVTRLARKAIREDTAVTRRSVAQYRRDIAQLKREVSELSRKISFLEAQEKRRLSEPSATPAASQQAASRKQGRTPAKRKPRFSPDWVRKHREKLGLSADDYGKLVGVSGQSIYLWESGRTRPRQAQLDSLAEVRGLRKREAQARLELLE
jgi:DNA-binding transcriptional regulator YiaG